MFHCGVANLRVQIRMSDDEIAAFLDEPHKMQLASINADGTPHLATMYYAVVDGRLAFWTYRTSQKAVNLRRDPRVGCLVEAGERYDDFHGVSINGSVETIEDMAGVRDIGAAVYGRYLDGFGSDMVGYLDQQASKRNAYLVDADSTASWDHRKIAAALAGTS